MTHDKLKNIINMKVKLGQNQEPGPCRPFASAIRLLMTPIASNFWFSNYRSFSRLSSQLCLGRHTKRLPSGFMPMTQIFLSKIIRYSKCWAVFSTYSPPELSYLSYHGTNCCILCSRNLPPGIGTTVTLISTSLSFWKRWRWQDRNFLRCKKRLKSLGAGSGL